MVDVGQGGHGTTARSPGWLAHVIAPHLAMWMVGVEDDVTGRLQQCDQPRYRGRKFSGVISQGNLVPSRTPVVQQKIHLICREPARRVDQGTEGFLGCAATHTPRALYWYVCRS